MRSLTLSLLAISGIFLLSQPEGPNAERWTYEAEDYATISPPARVVAAPFASGSKAVNLSAPDAPDKLGSSGNIRGEVTYRFPTMPNVEYTAWGRLMWHCTCSRQLRITTANQEDSLGEVNSLFASNTPPKNWGWEKIATFKGIGGPQGIQITQEGHLTLIDKVVISDEPNFRPAGSELATYSVDSCTSVSAIPLAVTEMILFSTETFMNFRLSLAFLKPGSDGLISSMDTRRRLLLGVQDERNYHSLEIHESQGEPSLRLSKVIGGEEIHLSETKLSLDESVHSMRILKDSEDLKVQIDNSYVLEKLVPSLVMGWIGWTGPNCALPWLSEVHIRELGKWQEDFTGDLEDWSTICGEWRKIEGKNSEGLGTVYAGRASTVAVSVISEDVGEEFTAKVRFSNLGTGGGGIGLTTDYGAFAVVAMPEGGNIRPELIHLRDGKVEESTLPQLPITADAWHEIVFSRRLDEIKFEVDGKWAGTAQNEGILLSRNLCLVALEGPAAFSNIEMTAISSFDDRISTFEPGVNSSSCANWSVNKGGIRLHGHNPAAMICKGDGPDESFSLTLRGTVPPRFGVGFTCRLDHTGAKKEKEPEEFDMSGALFPLLDPDLNSWVGFSFRSSQATKSELKVQVNFPQFNLVRLASEGKGREIKMVSDTLHRSDRSFEATFGFQSLRIRVGSATTEIPLEERQSLPGYFDQIILNGDNLGEQEVVFTEISMMEKASIIGSPSGGNSGKSAVP